MGANAEDCCAAQKFGSVSDVVEEPPGGEMVVVYIAVLR